MGVKRFKSSTSETIRVASTNGLTYIVGSEWVDIAHPDLQSLAYAAGCISEDMIVNKEVENVVESGMMNEVNRIAALKEEVRLAIQKALDSNNLDAFTKGGKPKVGYIRDNVNDKVPNHILDAVWNKMEDQLPVEVSEDEELMSDIT